MIFSVRPTTIADTALLPAIEQDAGQRFRDIPELTRIADGPVISLENHQQFVRRGMSWVALADNRPVGFLLAEAQGKSLFIVEISLHRAWQGKGLGRKLMAYMQAWASQRRFSELTLTTFRDVPWNAPWYARMGFEMLPETSLSAALRPKLAQEVAHGMAYESRCAMRLMLS